MASTSALRRLACQPLQLSNQRVGHHLRVVALGRSKLCFGGFEFGSNDVCAHIVHVVGLLGQDSETGRINFSKTRFNEEALLASRRRHVEHARAQRRDDRRVARENREIPISAGHDHLIGIVTNIDPEHLDHFKTVENMHREYEAFIKGIPFYGLAVACIDHPVLADMIGRLGLRRDGRRLLTYGEATDADVRLLGYRIDGHTTHFDVALSRRIKGGARRLDGLAVPLPGLHNALNALAAIAVASEASVPDQGIRSALASFSGVKRRFQPTGTWNGVTIYDDYGHHPAEIAAVLKAARAGARGRVIAVMEPHRFSRVRDLFGEFAACFSDADSVVVMPLYTAGEAPIEGVNTHALAEAVRRTGHRSVAACGSPQELTDLLRHHAMPGDMVVCLGAGVSTEWAYALPDWLAQTPRRASAGGAA